MMHAEYTWTIGLDRGKEMLLSDSEISACLRREMRGRGKERHRLLLHLHLISAPARIMSSDVIWEKFDDSQKM